MNPFLTCSSLPHPLHRNAIRSPHRQPHHRWIWAIYAALKPSTRLPKRAGPMSRCTSRTSSHPRAWRRAASSGRGLLAALGGIARYPLLAVGRHEDEVVVVGDQHTRARLTHHEEVRVEHAGGAFPDHGEPGAFPGRDVGDVGRVTLPAIVEP